ncbi:unnamed protein product [Prunus armeniaca]
MGFPTKFSFYQNITHPSESWVVLDGEAEFELKSFVFLHLLYCLPHQPRSSNQGTWPLSC